MGDLWAKNLPEDGKIKQNSVGKKMAESKERMLFKRIEILKYSTTGLFVAKFRASKQFANRNSHQEMFLEIPAPNFLKTMKIKTISLQVFFKDFAFFLAISLPKNAFQWCICTNKKQLFFNFQSVPVFPWRVVFTEAGIFEKCCS